MSLPPVVNCLLLARPDCERAELFRLRTPRGEDLWLGFNLAPGTEITAPMDGWYLGAYPTQQGMSLGFGARPSGQQSTPGRLTYCPGPVFRVYGALKVNEPAGGVHVRAGSPLAMVESGEGVFPGGYNVAVSLGGEDPAGRRLDTLDLRDLFPRAFAVPERLVLYEPPRSSPLVTRPIYLDPKEACDTVRLPSPGP